MIVFVMLAFAIYKLRHMIIRHNPLVNTRVENNSIKQGESITGSDPLLRDFKVAFAVEDSLLKTSHVNPKYVKIAAFITQATEGDEKYTELSVHQCTKEELEEFYPVEERFEIKFQDFSSQKRELYCVDYGGIELDFYGTISS